MSNDTMMIIKISAEGPRTRITVDVPESVRTALKAKSMKERRTQGELTTEALIRFFTAPIGSYHSKELEPSIKKGGNGLPSLKKGTSKRDNDDRLYGPKGCCYGCDHQSKCFDSLLKCRQPSDASMEHYELCKPCQGFVERPKMNDTREK